MNSTTGKPTIIPEFEMEAVAPDADASLLARLGRKGLLKQLSGLVDGELRVVEVDGTQHRFGARTARCPLAVTIHVSNVQFYADTAFGGSTGAGESYIKGHWRCDDLTALVRIMVVNRDVLEGMESGFARVGALAASRAALDQPQHQGAAARATSPRTTTSATSSTS